MGQARWAGLALAALLVAGPGAAQTTTCYGRYVPIDVQSIDQVPNGDGRYRYYITLYNRSAYPYTFDLTFSGFERVVLGSPVMANIEMPISGTVSNLMFGFGTNANINRTTVRRVYDQRPSPGGATVRITNCRQGRNPSIW